MYSISSPNKKKAVRSDILLACCILCVTMTMVYFFFNSTARSSILLVDIGSSAEVPEVDGMEACMRIREFSNVPIIMLTAKSEDADKLIGFESGADDYLTKPFNILELKARVRALLRRATGTQRSTGTVLTAGNISLNTEERVAVRGGESVDLTAKEYDLAELLMRNPRRVYSRENLM